MEYEEQETFYQVPIESMQNKLKKRKKIVKQYV